MFLVSLKFSIQERCLVGRQCSNPCLVSEQRLEDPTETAQEEICFSRRPGKQSEPSPASVGPRDSKILGRLAMTGPCSFGPVLSPLLSFSIRHFYPISSHFVHLSPSDSRPLTPPRDATRLPSRPHRRPSATRHARSDETRGRANAVPPPTRAHASAANAQPPTGSGCTAPRA